MTFLTNPTSVLNSLVLHRLPLRDIIRLKRVSHAAKTTIDDLTSQYWFAHLHLSTVKLEYSVAVHVPWMTLPPALATAYLQIERFTQASITAVGMACGGWPRWSQPQPGVVRPDQETQSEARLVTQAIRSLLESGSLVVSEIWNHAVLLPKWAAQVVKDPELTRTLLHLCLSKFQGQAETIANTLTSVLNSACKGGDMSVVIAVAETVQAANLSFEGSDLAAAIVNPDPTFTQWFLKYNAQHITPSDISDALLTAAGWNHPRVVQTLIAESGRTVSMYSLSAALKRAAMCGFPGMVELLLQAGANPTLAEDASEDDTQTTQQQRRGDLSILMVAARRRGNGKVVEVLVKEDRVKAVGAEQKEELAEVLDTAVDTCGVLAVRAIVESGLASLDQIKAVLQRLVDDGEGDGEVAELLNEVIAKSA